MGCSVSPDLLVDYSTGRPSTAALKSAGVRDVARYLSWLPNPKVIDRSEYQSLTAAGFGIALVWEYEARDWLTGATAGRQHATEAVRQAKVLGHPAGAGIYGGADLDMSSGQWTASTGGKAYGKAFRDGVRAGGYRAGVYGPADVLTWCRTDLQFDLFWQAGMSTAWSGGRNRSLWTGAHLRQRRVVTIDSVPCDANDILISNYGQGGNMATGDADKAFSAPYTGTEPWINSTSWMARAVETPLRTLAGNVSAVAADARAARVAIEALAAAVAAGGGDIETATVIAHMDQLAAEDQAREEQFLARIAELEQALADRDQRLADALAPGDTSP